ncbi:MAG TPA: hypothetical protein DCX60_08335 [Phycisphaerales bacterium]|nr:hypothetical protein [Phycisphaerales bacterium]
MTQNPHRRVLASAGTGKTHRLTSRFLQLMVEGSEARAILATTFTRAAAAEIRDRILTRVAKAALAEADLKSLGTQIGHPDLDSKQVLSLLDGLLRDLGSLQISTIDSFIGRVTSAFSAELGLASDAEVLYDDGQRGLQDRTLRRAFESLESTAEMDAFATALDGLSKGSPRRSLTESLRSIIKDGMAVYNQSDGLIGPWESPFDEGLKSIDPRSFIPRLKEAADRRPTGPKGKRKSVAKNLDALRALLEGYDDDQDCFALLAEPLSKGVALKVRLGEPTYVEKTPIDEMTLEVMSDLLAFFDRVVKREYARRTLSTFKLLDRYHAAREDIRRELDVATFDDLVRVLAHADSETLRHDIWFRLDGRISHLLLDEFQDTSLMQWKVLRPLAEEIVSDSSGERTFFCVGDVKQSIYGWRGGLPGILEHLDRMVLPGGGITEFGEERLDRSYRTGPCILGIINRVFGELHSLDCVNEAAELKSAAIRFGRLWDEHRSEVEKLPGCFELVATRVDDEEKRSSAEARQDAALRASQLAADLHRAHPGCSIGVLTPRNQVAGLVVEHLRDMGIDATGEGGGSFLDCGASIVFLETLRLAEHPGDSAAAFNIARSPLGSLLEFVFEDDSSSELSRRLRRRFITDGVAQTMEGWVAELAGRLDRREISRLERLLIEVQRIEANGERSLALMLKELERLGLDEPGADVVRVLTIHKSKGLAFDLVVLAGLDEKMVSGTPVLVTDQPVPPGEIVQVSSWVKKGLVPDDLQPMQDVWKADVAFERLCQLYVAMTRARQGLFAVVAPSTASGSREGSMGALLREVLGGPGVGTDPARPELLASAGSREDLPSAVSVQADTGGGRSLAFDLVPGDLDLVASAPSAVPSSDVRGDPDGEQPLAGRAYGIAIHALFESIHFIEDASGDDSMFRSTLCRISPDRSEVWREAVLSDFHAMLANDQIRSLLSRHPDSMAVGEGENSEAERELSWLRRTSDGRIQEGILDRLVVTRREGVPQKALVIDWKTDRVASGEEIMHAESYRPQLEAYREAACQLTGLAGDRVAVVLVFVRNGILVPLES